MPISKAKLKKKLARFKKLLFYKEALLLKFVNIKIIM